MGYDQADHKPVISQKPVNPPLGQKPDDTDELRDDYLSEPVGSVYAAVCLGEMRRRDALEYGPGVSERVADALLGALS